VISDDIERVLEEGTISVHRLPIQYSAYFAVQEPAPPVSTPPLLIACHGYAQSCKGFIRNFEPLRERNWLVAAPQGANQLYWEGGKVGFTWMTRYMREHTIRDNLAYMARFVDVIRGGYGINPARIFALGFSQGSAMAHRLGASGFIRPAGVVQCGGDLPPDVEARLGELDPYPVLIVHGLKDPQMSLDKAQEGEAALRKHNWPVDTIYFDGEHDLPPEIVGDIVAWMDQRPDAIPEATTSR
jgi:polyhydroxybutyrate depolymerase